MMQQSDADADTAEMKESLSSVDCAFREIRPPPSKPKLPDRIQVYVARGVNPKQCRSFIQDLQRQFGATSSRRSNNIGHLKRVRKQNDLTKEPPPATAQTNIASDDNGSSSPPTKKSKTSSVDTSCLQVLLGAVLVDSSDEKTSEDYTPLLTKYSATLDTKWVPGRPAENKQELKEFNELWPTVYYHARSQEHKDQELQLSTIELAQMQVGMQHAIDDAGRAKSMLQNCSVSSSESTSLSCVASGAIIVEPQTGTVVATACDERLQQQTTVDDDDDDKRIMLPDLVNPLCTSVLLAIQGVSRKERAAAVGYGMDSDAFQKGQYLCTGYDLYTTREPGVFEAMALVHSRIRRVIFGVANHVDGGLGGTGMRTAVHALNTNHHYRAFSCAPDTNLWAKCKATHSND